MEEYALTARDMSKVYQESYDTIATTLDKLKPEQEYTALIQENKRLCIFLCTFYWL